MVLEVKAGIKLDSGASVILYHIFKREMAIRCLKMTGQTVIASAKIETFVFETEAEVPFASDEEPMVVSEIVIKRITVAHARIGFEIAFQGINQVVGKEIEGILPLGGRGGGRLLHCRFGAGKEDSGSSKRQNP